MAAKDHIYILLRGMIMINTITLINRIGEHVRITCIDGQIIEGILDSVDDEEESGLGEEGVSISTPYGAWVGVGRSEIRSIQFD